MRHLHKIAVICLSLFCLTPAFAQSTLQVNKDFSDGTMTWGSHGGGLVYKFKVLVSDGIVVMCGARAFVGHDAHRLTRQAMKDAYFSFDKKTPIMKDISYFTKVKKKSQLANATATCRSTGVKAPKGRFTVWINYANKRYRN